MASSLVGRHRDPGHRLWCRTPATGPPGLSTPVTIAGTDMEGVTSVMFGTTTAATFVVNSAGTKITTAAPPESSGAVILSVTTPGGTASSTFTYQAATSLNLVQTYPSASHTELTATLTPDSLGPVSATGAVEFFG